MLRLAGAHREAVDVLFVGIAGAGIGVAGREVPAFHQLTGNFQFQAFGGCAACGFVYAFVGERVGADRLGDVVLLDTEKCQAGIESAVEVSRLQTGFIAVAFDRVESGAVGVLVALRLIDRGVAGVHRIGVVQVIHHAGIGRDHAMLFVARGVVGEDSRVQTVVIVVIVVLEGADTGTEDHRQLIGGAQAGGDVGTVLAFLLFILAVFREVRHADMAVPIENAARNHGEFAGVPGAAGLA
ncbi:hypothetical protein D3C79_639710 [compost metagenome]